MFKEIFKQSASLQTCLLENLEESSIDKFKKNSLNELEKMLEKLLKVQKEINELDEDFYRLLGLLEQALPGSSIKSEFEQIKKDKEKVKIFFKEQAKTYEERLKNKYENSENHCVKTFFKDYCKSKIEGYFMELASRYNELSQLELEANTTKGNLEKFKVLVSLLNIKASGEKKDDFAEPDASGMMISTIVIDEKAMHMSEHQIASSKSKQTYEKTETYNAVLTVLLKKNGSR